MGLKNFIKNLQNSDEAAKKRWLIGLSAASMIIVISLWLIYLNYSLKKIEPAEERSEIAFWTIFKTGAKVIGKEIKEKAKDLWLKIAKERTITIEINE